MKKNLISIFLILCPFLAISQNLQIEFDSGIGTFSMKDLKIVAAEIGKSIDFKTKIVDNFPPYFYYRPTIALKNGNYKLGITYNFQSTGARISSKDYSGEFLYDMKINSNSIGFLNEIDTDSGKVIFSFYNNTGMNFSTIQSTQSLIVFGEKAPEINENNTSESIYTELGVKVKVMLGKFGLGVHSGYNYQFRNKKVLTPQWNGIRAGLNISYTFKKKS